MTTLAQQLAFWSDKLRDLSAFGLHYADNIYDRTRYQEIQDIALEMLAASCGERVEDLEPLRTPVMSRATPLSAGEGVVIDDAGRVLLIQRSDNHQWAIPGGAMEVGETPAQGARREVLEETGVHCQPVALVGYYDSRLTGIKSPLTFYLVTFLCRPERGREVELPSHPDEILQMGWFYEDQWPKPITEGTQSRLHHAYRLWRDPARPAVFDRDV